MRVENYCNCPEPLYTVSPDFQVHCAECGKAARASQRPDFDWLWMQVAHLVKLRGTCPRRRVGAVIVNSEFQIISTGYNGSPKGLPHCTDVGCRIEHETGRCKRTVHAEQNALLQAGPRAVGGILYVTDFPCLECANQISNAGIRAVWFSSPYQTQAHKTGEVVDQFTAANIAIRRMRG